MPEKPVVTRKTSISPARTRAFKILLEMGRASTVHSDDLLRGPLVNALSQQDRNLCVTLTMGVLRWQLWLDAQIAPLLTHAVKMDEPVRVALRLGAFQLLFLDRVPIHAVISDSVELTKRAGHRFASGLVNAVLRKLAVGPRTVGHAIQAHPTWMVERWRGLLSASEVDTICAYDQQQPSVYVCFGAALPAMEGVVLDEANFLAGARRVVSGDVAGQEAIRIQDEGSQLVAWLGGRPGTRVESILDCCAAPGGKTAILAQRYADARVVAADVRAARVAQMRALFDTSPKLVHIETRVADATSLDGNEQFDLILCDVPCSGTGTLGRNPEIKLRLRVEDLSRQRERQIAILGAALRALKPGGELVYSTCSLEPEENESVVEQALAKAVGVSRVPVMQRIEELRAAGVLHTRGAELLMSKGVCGESLRIPPGTFQTDGFFASILTRG